MSNIITKNQKAEVKTKSGSSYSYQYVDIAQIHEYLESINSKYIQCIDRVEGDDYIMTKRCIEGRWEDEWLRGSRVVDATLFGTDNPAQKQGSALTYARRYSLLMAFGLATEDDDGNILNELPSKQPTLEDAKQYVINFGKYSGTLLREVFEDDESYIDWILENSKDQYLLKCIDLLFKEQPEQNNNQQKIDLSLLTKFEKLIIETKSEKEDIYNYFKVKNNTEMTNEQLQEAVDILQQKKSKMKEQN